jgi:hypothetical protein
MALAARSLPEGVIYTVGWDGGVNMRDAANKIAQNEARIMENGFIDELGAFTKRLGCQSLGTYGLASNRVLSATVFYRTGALAPQLVIHTTAGTLLYTNDPAANPQVWTQIATGLSTTVPMSFETFKGTGVSVNKLYFCNGVDAYASWDGTTYATYPSAPKGRYLRLWKDTMWVSGVPGNQDRIYSSAPGDVESYPVANWVDIAVGDGDQVTALSTDGNYLIVFKRNRHMVVYDPVTYANRIVDMEKGCEGHFSVIQFGSGIYFLSRRGICQYLGDAPARFVSGKIEPLFDQAVINIGALSNVAAYTFGNRVGWCLPEVGSNVATLQVEYYPLIPDRSGVGPFLFHRMPISTAVKYRSGTIEYMFGASTITNKVYRCFGPVGTDDGASFTALLETGTYGQQAPLNTKYVRTMRFLGRGVITFQLKRNYDDNTIYRNFPVTLDPNAVVELNPDAYGQFFVMRITDASAATGVREVDVGSVERIVTEGEWSVFEVIAQAYTLGMRTA